MDIEFVESFRGHTKGEVCHLPFHEAKPLMELGVARPVRKRRAKAVHGGSERAVKQ